MTEGIRYIQNQTNQDNLREFRKEIESYNEEFKGKDYQEIANILLSKGFSVVTVPRTDLWTIKPQWHNLETVKQAKTEVNIFLGTLKTRDGEKWVLYVFE